MARVQVKFLFALCFLAACSQHIHHTPSLTDRKPVTMSEKIIYNLTKKGASEWVQTTSPLAKVETVGLKRLRDLGNEFLEDLGGKRIILPLSDNKQFSFYYFDPKTFRKNETPAYKKWRKKFSEAKNCKLAEMFHLDFQAGTLTTMLRLPHTVFSLQGINENIQGAILFPSCGIENELDPKFLLSYLARGLPVVSLSYNGLLDGDSIDVETIFEVTLSIANWLKKTLDCEETEIIFTGKSFGSALATYGAAHFRGSPLIIEGGFSRLSEAVQFPFSKITAFFLKPFATQVIETFYRFPIEDWIAWVSGPIVMIQPYEESYQKQGEKLLISLSKKSEKKKNLIQAKGSLFGIYWGDPNPTWYEDEKTQQKLTDFLLHP